MRFLIRQMSGEISPERLRPDRLMEEMVGGDEVAHLIPAQVQKRVEVVLDQVERLF